MKRTCDTPQYKIHNLFSSLYRICVGRKLQFLCRIPHRHVVAGLFLEQTFAASSPSSPLFLWTIRRQGTIVRGRRPHSTYSLSPLLRSEGKRDHDAINPPALLRTRQGREKKDWELILRCPHHRLRKIFRPFWRLFPRRRHCVSAV